MENKKNLSSRQENDFNQSPYRFSLSVRLLIVLIVTLMAVLTTLGVLPLARLMDVDPSTLQGAGFRPNFKTMTIGILYSASQFLLIWLVMRFIHRKNFLSLGFKRLFWRFFLIGTAIGMAMAVAEIGLNSLIGGNVSIEWNVPEGTPFYTVTGYFLLWFLFLLTLNSLKEELVFRAYPIEMFNDQPKAMVWVILFASLIFAAVHHIIEPFTLSAFLSRFSIALVFCFAYYRWRSIWLIVGIHNGTNFVGFLLGGHWKSGGLFSLEYNSPTPEIVILVDLLVKMTALGMLYFYWKSHHPKLLNH
jgi:membrane protease YdiL (CAAX protease family)